MNTIIEQLGLESCADVVIGDEMTRGVSGGQAKRVNAGMELITQPAVLFLDEPTSGVCECVCPRVACPRWSAGGRPLRVSLRAVLFLDEPTSGVCALAMHAPVRVALRRFCTLLVVSAPSCARHAVRVGAAVEGPFA